jgi:uncharacterized protein YndB with AHSA1/START domain
MQKIRTTLLVASLQAEAFEEFTRHLDQWWPPVGRGAAAPKAFVEPEVGGRWFERDTNRVEQVWGVVLEWNPPHGLTLSWQVAADGDFHPDLKTEIEVCFTMLSPTATLVSLEHRHLERYGAAAAAQRTALASTVGWPGILEHFARHCVRVVETRRFGRVTPLPACDE